VSGLLVRTNEARSRAFRRTLGASALGHALLLGLLLLNPSFGRSRSMLPAVVEVSLVAAAPAAAPAVARPASRPAPAPAPAKPPPPKPPPPKPDKVVLPKDATRKPEAKPKQAKPKAAPPAKDPPKDLEDVLAELREESGEESPEPAEVASAASPSRGGIGIPISAEEAAWRRRAKAHVRQNWVLEPGFRQQRLETEIEVELGPTGEVLEVEVTKRSGNPWYDESVERAIRKASPLPAPLEPGAQAFVFRPEDIL
jgi:colicin import membrane protein